MKQNNTKHDLTLTWKAHLAGENIIKHNLESIFIIKNKITYLKFSKVYLLFSENICLDYQFGMKILSLLN